MTRRQKATRWGASILTLAAAGLATIVIMAPSALSARTSAGAAPTSRTCTVAALSYVHHGNENLVTRTSVRCNGSQRAGGAAGAKKVSAKKVLVGYGCSQRDFLGTCWEFQVAGPCAKNGHWLWPTLAPVVTDHMKSFIAINSCRTAVVWSKTKFGGSKETSHAASTSLGKLNDHDKSLSIS
jgi:hypothetical protein